MQKMQKRPLFQFSYLMMLSLCFPWLSLVHESQRSKSFPTLPDPLYQIVSNKGRKTVHEECRAYSELKFLCVLKVIIENLESSPKPLFLLGYISFPSWWNFCLKCLSIPYQPTLHPGLSCFQISMSVRLFLGCAPTGSAEILLEVLSAAAIVALLWTWRKGTARVSGSLMSLAGPDSCALALGKALPSISILLPPGAWVYLFVLLSPF